MQICNYFVYLFPVKISMRKSLLTHLGLRLFEMRNFGPYARNEKDNSRDFKHASISSRSLYLVVEKQDTERRPEWKNRTCSGCNGKETVGWAQVEDQMVRVQGDSEWKTRMFFFLSLSPSLSELNIKNVTRWMQVHERNINLRFPVAVCNATDWPFSRDIKLYKYDWSISKYISWIKIHLIWSDFKFIIIF